MEVGVAVSVTVGSGGTKVLTEIEDDFTDGLAAALHASTSYIY